MGATKKVISCRDAGAECDWSVSDVEEEEVIASAIDHAKRRHNMEVTPDQVRPLVKDVKCGC